IIAKHGLDGLFLTTLISGALLVLIGATGLGTAVDFLPRSVVVGFTNGIALLIASTQIKDLLGLPIAKVSGAFVPRMTEIFGHAAQLSPVATALGVGAVVVVVLFQRYLRAVPGAIVALVLAPPPAPFLRLPLT